VSSSGESEWISGRGGGFGEKHRDCRDAAVNWLIESFFNGQKIEGDDQSHIANHPN
jgi:hypothetical protein